MPNSLSRETLRTILSDLPSVRTERQRRRVPSGMDEELLAFVADAFGYTSKPSAKKTRFQSEC